MDSSTKREDNRVDASPVQADDIDVRDGKVAPEPSVSGETAVEPQFAFDQPIAAPAPDPPVSDHAPTQVDAPTAKEAPAAEPYSPIGPEPADHIAQVPGQFTGTFPASTETDSCAESSETLLAVRATSVATALRSSHGGWLTELMRPLVLLLASLYVVTMVWVALLCLWWPTHFLSQVTSWTHVFALTAPFAMAGAIVLFMIASTKPSDY